jgi:hypothetical protein
MTGRCCALLNFIRQQKLRSYLCLSGGKPHTQSTPGTKADWKIRSAVRVEIVENARTKRTGDRYALI